MGKMFPVVALQSKPLAGSNIVGIVGEAEGLADGVTGDGVGIADGM
jgi:hypothetical protein